jgi:hypothetical protein
VVGGYTAAIRAGQLGLKTACVEGAPVLEDSMREIAGIRIPDSKLAVAALDLVKIESHASIYKHVLRTLVFGGLAARAEGIGFDEELFFLGAVLHDLGLTERFGATAGRFEVVGADAAEKFLLGEGAAAERSAVVWEAIASLA